MQKNKSYRRYQHKKHAIRHKKITKQIYNIDNYFDTFNKYDSFKIHCSCPWCSPRTRNKGRHRNTKNCAPSINYKMMDKRRQMAMDDDEKEFFN